MKNKQDMIAWIEGNAPKFTAISDEIWAHPELSLHEFRASRLQAEYMASLGFRITWDIGGINTAFVAEWGNGKPVIGFAGEYDALENLSQKNQPDPEPIIPGAPGHGCGHNLLGTGCMAAAAAVKVWMETEKIPGTVRYYGCPAEEKGNGKAFMARAGAFDDLDAAFNYHPGVANNASKGSSVALTEARFRFHGTTSHAGLAPELGRSALDAVELMNVGVNYLREHVTEKVRMHYVISNGGDLPNIVPGEAEVWYFLRAPQREELNEVVARVCKIARGAALMTGTRVEEIITPGCYPLLNNHTLSDLQYEALKVIGPIHFTEEEMAYAQKINDHFPPENMADLFNNYPLPEEVRGIPLLGDNYPALDEGKVGTGSTDVGDLSWITPLSMLETACNSTAAPGHSWSIVATGGMSIGHKGMLHAAKVMALAAMDCFTDPQILMKARKEFETALKGRHYVSLLPPEMKPPRYEPGEMA